MWNKTEERPIGKCRLVVENPKNERKYSLPFVVFDEDRTPVIGYRTSLKMKLIKLEHSNVEIVNTIDDVESNDEVFDSKELGQFPGEQNFRLKGDAVPRVMANRRVPLSTKPKIKAELDRLTELGVMTPVTVPTPWISQMVITSKKSGEIRICLDPHELNKVIMREHLTLPILEDVLHELRDAKVFSKADLQSGFWHVKLDSDSSYLTTFQTPFGRYRYLRLPFGISGASEYFQRKLHEALKDLDGIVCVADDIVIHGKDVTEHDRRLKAFLARCQEVGIKLNKEKSATKVESMTFMGHQISPDGIRLDATKVAAIRDIKEPSNLRELRTFLGMVNYLAKFLPNGASLMSPLNNLLKKEVSWNWSTAQDDAFKKVKFAITSAPVLAYYDPSAPLTLENDASEYGLGSALLQNGKPIAFASRSLSDAERHYAQIEKEMLAVTYGLEKFHHYTFGRGVHVVTDHKPLVAISRKPLSKAPRRLQNLLLRAQHYDYNLSWQPGKTLVVAVALFRAPTQKSTEFEIVGSILEERIKDDRLKQIRAATAEDKTLKDLGTVIVAGWPSEKSDLPQYLKPYFDYRDELSVYCGVIYRGERIVIPTSLRQDVKKRVHAGHLGINSCLRRARDLVYWPGMSTEIRQHVEACGTCATYAERQAQDSPMISEIPERPWHKVAADLLSWGGEEYMVTVDYHSNFFELDKLRSTTSDAIKNVLKQHFARYGPPEILVTDNGPQFTSSMFKTFIKEWEINHNTISPGHSQSNGAAEVAVKIAKRILRKCGATGEDVHIALLNLRNTPSEGLNTSPSQR
eukprot:GHVU01148538.1.p1 GENE.GHVU01148538.1~~GHVU01148538.1.p1  ORF type:complete len:917 (+),score=68.85 GHVU01148538.1:344-2752(+)